jgi:hypothetical protein
MALSNSRWTLLRGIAQHEFESPILRAQRARKIGLFTLIQKPRATRGAFGMLD